LTDDVIAKAVAEATLHAPMASIDLTEWVFTLTDSEFQPCSQNHIAAAATLTPEGNRMSINVERVGNLWCHPVQLRHNGCEIRPSRGGRCVVPLSIAKICCFGPPRLAAILTHHGGVLVEHSQ
jgi:hypothetical protein